MENRSNANLKSRVTRIICEKLHHPIPHLVQTWPVSSNGACQVVIDGFVMSLTMHNQGHTQVSPTSLNTPKCRVHGIHLATWHPRPLARRGLGIGTTRPLILEICHQLPVTYYYQLLALGFSIRNLGHALYWCGSLRNLNGSTKIRHTTPESKGSLGIPPCVLTYPSRLI